MTASRSASASMGTDDWLDHGEYGGGKFFKLDFKEKDEYFVWLHPKSDIRAFWRVVWFYVDEDGKLRINRWTSMEDPSILGRFRFTNDDGSREHTPQVDPFCKLIDWVGVQIEAGKIGFTDEIFKFELEDDEKVIHAGGFTGDFMSKDTKEDPEKKKAIRKVGVRLDEAYKENCNAQEETVFIVIDNEEPSNGPQIVTIGRGLSRAFKEEIKRRKTAFGAKKAHEADPFKFPVCFSWKKDTSGEFAKFMVVATQDELTDEIKAAFEEPVPDTSKLFEPSNVAVLRKSFEEHWCHEEVPDWDEIFGAAFEAVKGTPAAKLPDESGSDDEEDEDEDEEKSHVKSSPKASKPEPKKVEKKTEVKSKKEPPKEEPKDEEEDETEEEEKKEDESSESSETDEEVSTCDLCDGVLDDEVFESDPVVCPHCGARYEWNEKTETYDIQEEKKAVQGSRRPK